MDGRTAIEVMWRREAKNKKVAASNMIQNMEQKSNMIPEIIPEIYLYERKVSQPQKCAMLRYCGQWGSVVSDEIEK